MLLGCELCLLEFAQKLTKKIFRALAHTGQRAVIQRGWAKLGEIPGSPLPPNVHVIDSVPHDWLFPLCSGVVHHGARGRLFWKQQLSAAWQARGLACPLAIVLRSCMQGRAPGQRACMPTCHSASLMHARKLSICGTMSI